MRSTKHCMNILLEFGITELDAKIVSSGNNGCYIFYIDEGNCLQKDLLEYSGLSYMSENEFRTRIRKLPIRNKKEPNLNKEPLIFIKES
jgi:hypothetical protein